MLTGGFSVTLGLYRCRDSGGPWGYALVAMRTIAVIPALNEEATVGDVVDAVTDLGFASVVVDDGSSDETSSVADAAGAVVLRHPTNIGVGGALRTGFLFAVEGGYQRVICIDADFQHDPSSVRSLIAEADATGAQLMIGSRFGGDGYQVGAARRLLMRGLASVVSRRVRTQLDDVTSGFRVVSEPLLSRFAADYPADYLGDTVEAILDAHGTGASVAQATVRMRARPSGDATSRAHAAGHLLRLLLVLAVTPRTEVK